MTVKVGDIVRYCNCNARVMLIDGPLVRLSHFGIVNRLFNDSEVVESTKLPTLAVGDKVKINMITPSEKLYYGGGWSSTMSGMLGRTFTVNGVRDSDVCGTLVDLDGWWCEASPSKLRLDGASIVRFYGFSFFPMIDFLISLYSFKPEF